MTKPNNHSSQVKPNTEAYYRKNYKRLLDKSLAAGFLNEEEAIGALNSVSPTQLVSDWFASHTLSRVSPGSINVQRTSLLWVLKNDKPQGWKEAYDKVKAFKPLNVRAGRALVLTRSKIAPANALREADLGASHRGRVSGRVIPEDDLQKIVNKLLSINSPWGAKTQAFLIAGIASGARPIEWIWAHWSDVHTTHLRLYTAKKKLGNALVRAQVPNIHTGGVVDEGEDFRDVFIEPQYRAIVQTHLTAVKEAIATALEANPSQSLDVAFQHAFNSKAKHCLWRVCCDIFSGRDERLYSLSDTRQTFSANRKAMLGNEGAAKELGHSITVSRGSYAPASEAWSRYKEKPSQEQLNQPAQAPTPGPIQPNNTNRAVANA